MFISVDLRRFDDLREWKTTQAKYSLLNCVRRTYHRQLYISLHWSKLRPAAQNKSRKEHESTTRFLKFCQSKTVMRGCLGWGRASGVRVTIAGTKMQYTYYINTHSSDRRHAIYRRAESES